MHRCEIDTRPREIDMRRAVIGGVLLTIVVPLMVVALMAVAP